MGGVLNPIKPFLKTCAKNIITVALSKKNRTTVKLIGLSFILKVKCTLNAMPNNNTPYPTLKRRPKKQSTFSQQTDRMVWMLKKMVFHRFIIPFMLKKSSK